MRGLSTTIMIPEQEIGGLKKIIDKLLGRVHYRAADLYSTLKRLKSSSKGKSKNKSGMVDSC
jgi:hypothetical protein